MVFRKAGTGLTPACRRPGGDTPVTVGFALDHDWKRTTTNDARAPADGPPFAHGVDRVTEMM